MKSKWTKSFLLCGLLLSLAQCGEIGSLSKDVSVRFIPESPVVVHSDLKFVDARGEDVNINAPWFILSSRVKNESDNRLYLATYILNGKTVSKGVPKSFESATDPSSACEDRAYLAIIDPDETYERLGGVGSCDEDTPLSGAPASGQRYERWFFGGLPESDNDIYNVDIQAEGWFVDADDVPVERLTAFGFVSTQ